MPEMVSREWALGGGIDMILYNFSIGKTPDWEEALFSTKRFNWAKHLVNDVKLNNDWAYRKLRGKYEIKQDKQDVIY